MFSICVKSGRDQRLYYFDKSEIAIGRTEDNDLVLVDERVSKRHCKLLQREAYFYVYDLKSTNGTFLNQTRVLGCSALNIYDQIRVGDHVLWLTSDLGRTHQNGSLKSSHALPLASTQRIVQDETNRPSLADARPTKASLRSLLEQKLRFDHDLESFCIDYFSDIKHQFASGMDRTTKLNILLERADPILLSKYLQFLGLVVLLQA